MSSVPLLKVVLDTDIVFEGLTRRGGAAGMLVDAWLAGQICVYVSNAMAYEYVDVLSRKLSKMRWERVKPVLAVLLTRAHFVVLYYRWRPISPDPGDDHVIDCAMNAGATVVTANLRHFRAAEDSLGLRVIDATEAIRRIAGEVAPE
jgi:predicted nucleic acid-binding protein